MAAGQPNRRSDRYQHGIDYARTPRLMVADPDDPAEDEADDRDDPRDRPRQPPLGTAPCTSHAPILRHAVEEIETYAPAISLASPLTYDSGKLSWLNSAAWRIRSAAACASPLAS